MLILIFLMTTRDNNDKKLIKEQESYGSEGEFMLEVKKVYPDLLRNSDEEDSDNSPKFRDKYKELKQTTKEELSKSTQNAIEIEDTELDEIIKKLKSREIGEEKEPELQKLRNISKENKGVLR